MDTIAQTVAFIGTPEIKTAMEDSTVHGIVLITIQENAKDVYHLNNNILTGECYTVLAYTY